MSDAAPIAVALRRADRAAIDAYLADDGDDDDASRADPAPEPVSKE